MASFFCTAKKELPLVAFFYQQKIVSHRKKLFTAIWAKNETY
jgi:hypothetical protein